MFNAVTLLVFMILITAYLTKNVTLQIGVLTPYENPLGHCAFGALLLAKDYVKSHKIYDYDMRLRKKDSECSGKTAVGRSAELRQNDEVNVIMGLPCSNAAKSAGELLGYLERPLISWYAPDAELMNKTKYPTLVRTFPSIHTVISPIITLLRQKEWNHLAVILAEDDVDFSLWTLMRQEIENTEDIKLLDVLSCTHNIAKRCLEQLKTRARVILLVVPSETLEHYMTTANELEMGDKSDFVFIHNYRIEGMKSLHEIWKGPNKKQWQNVLLLSLVIPNQMEFINFIQKAILTDNESPSGSVLCSNESSTLSLVLSAYAYDSLVYYAYAKTLRDDGANWGDLLNWSQAVTKRYQYNGWTGPMKFDSNGDRVASYAVKHFQFGAWQTVGRIESNSKGSGYSSDNKLIWPSKTGKIPPAMPKCGFDGNKCQNNEAVIGTTVSLAVACLAAVAGYLFYRHKKNERLIFQRPWVIDSSDIVMRRGNDGNAPIDSTPLNSPRKRLVKMATRMTVSGFGSVISFDRLSTIHANIASYMNTLVVVRKCSKPFSSDRDTLENLKVLHEMKDDHINAFIGATVENEVVCLMAYCNKGSLRDVLDNDDIKLDSLFLLSFLSDIARGMHFLQNSVIASHGNLKSTNCVVDSRWVVKITDYGLLASAGPNNMDSQEEEDRFFKRLFWTAPELLRMQRRPPKGTAKADIYSFAIILQEVICRSEPYENNLQYSNTTPKDVVDTVMKDAKDGIVYRPLVFGDSYNAYPNCKRWKSKQPHLVSLMKECWLELPDDRPNFTIVKSVLKEINDGKKLQIVDHMLVMLETYANNLEHLVEERTDELEQEKQKTENLLNAMLPREVAGKLKLGQAVEPESFDSVSIFFSDIVGFTNLAAQSEPLQIVNMLNKLYTIFDEIIEVYIVYKVETIGDAYMVCSGLPNRNHDHASEIASMALDFLEAVQHFTVDHIPEKQLQLRIGLHVGPCVAGVVGIAMPRYCLFGDTVNTASRMESTGEGLKIQCSSAMNTELVLMDQGFRTEKRGEVEMKGKGKQITYWLLDKIGGTKLQNGIVSYANSIPNRRTSYMQPSSPADVSPQLTERRVSGQSEGTCSSEWLDLPDQSKDPNTESIRTLGDIALDRKSERGSSVGSVNTQIVSRNNSNSQADQQSCDKLSSTEDTPIEQRLHPHRKISFQQQKTALMQRADRKRYSLQTIKQGGVLPMKHSNDVNSKEWAVSTIFVKNMPEAGMVENVRSTDKNQERYILGSSSQELAPPDVPLITDPIFTRTGERGRVNVAFSPEVPDITVYAFSDDDEFNV